MKAIQFKSLKIIDVTASSSHMKTTYDMNSVEEHKLKMSIWSIIGNPFFYYTIIKESLKGVCGFVIVALTAYAIVAFILLIFKIHLFTFSVFKTVVLIVSTFGIVGGIIAGADEGYEDIRNKKMRKIVTAKRGTSNNWHMVLSTEWPSFLLELGCSDKKGGDLVALILNASRSADVMSLENRIDYIIRIEARIAEIEIENNKLEAEMATNKNPQKKLVKHELKQNQAEKKFLIAGVSLLNFDSGGAKASTVNELKSLLEKKAPIQNEIKGTFNIYKASINRLVQMQTKSVKRKS